MRAAALYDIHGNLPALEAVLADVAAEGVDEIVVGGDVLWGPLQVECVELLRAVDAVFVRGNCERDVLRPEHDTARWCAAQLDDRTRSFVARWPLTLEREIEGVGTVLFCHATPRSDDEIVTAITPDDVVRDALSGVQATLVVCGHTHVQFDRAPPGAPRLVNAGSVGLPYEGMPGARWALVGGGIEARHTAYDVERAFERLEPARFPSFTEVFSGSLRGTTTSDEATAKFESRRGR